MKAHWLTWLLRAGFGVAFGFGILPKLVPCCGVSAGGGPVRFGDQTTLVVWDKERKIEHFVRQANFSFPGADMGFIAPTPSRPELEEVGDKIFQILRSLIPPEPHIEGTEGAAPAAAAATAEVEVIQQKDVAGFRATTLRASDAQALAQWMRAHHYTTSPGIQAWTKKYIDKGWYLTAFRVLGGEPKSERAGLGSTRNIRMTFQTEQPFNPYFVPEDNRSRNGANLNLFFLAQDRYEGLVGSELKWIEPDWEADVPSESKSQIENQLYLKYGSLPGNLHLASYRDRSFAEVESDDLYFRPVPPPYVVYGIGLACVITCGLVARRRLKPSAL